MAVPAMLPVEPKAFWEGKEYTVAAGKVQQDSMQAYHLAGAALFARMAQVPPPYGSSEESGSATTADVEESQPPSKHFAQGGRSAAPVASGAKPAAPIASGGSLNKTKLCTFFLAKGRCPRGKKCQFAHGEHELRHKPDLFKTEICHAFAATGKCRYGKKCSFAHSTTETPPGIPQMPPPSDDIVNLKLELDLMKRASNELQSKIGNLERLVGNADNATCANFSSMSGRSSSSGSLDAFGGEASGVQSYDGLPSSGSLDAFGGEVSGVPSYNGLPSYDLLHPSQMQLLPEEVMFGGRGYQMAAPDESRIGAAIRLSV